jgi:hypothetical protein
VRGYSTENKIEEGKQEENKENGESEPEDLVRKELEKKEKEIVDLKVKFSNHAPRAMSYTPVSAFFPIGHAR